MGSLCVNFRQTVVPLIVSRRNSFCATSTATQPGLSIGKGSNVDIKGMSNEAKIFR